MVTVSVILPTYNRAHVVSRAIRSVLEQTYEDFELIVVDDGSTDSTEEVVRSFDDRRIRYIRHKQNKGRSAARNTGIKIAKGEYIAFQDSDDEWLPEKLEEQMEVFKTSSPQVGVVYTGFYLFYDDKKIYIPSANVKTKDGNIYDELLKGNFVGTPAAVVRAECLKKVGMFDESLHCLEDWELFIRISKEYIFKYIDKALVNAFRSPNSILLDPDACATAMMLIMEKHIYPLGDQRRLAEMQYSIGNYLFKSEKICEGRARLLCAWKLDPLNIKYFLAYLASLLGKNGYVTIVRLKRLLLSVR